MLRRLLALAAAAAMVAGAVALRGRLDDRAEAGGTSTTNGAATSTTERAAARPVVCATELAAECSALQAAGVATLTEAAGTTADRLRATEAAAPLAWLTLSGWAQSTDDARTRAGLAPLFGPPNPIGSSPVVAVARADRATALATHCGGAVTFTCIGEVAGGAWSSAGGDAAWGAVRIGAEPAATSARGLATFAAATAGYFGRTDVSTADFADDAYRSWARRIVASVPSLTATAGSPLTQLVVLPATYGLVLTTEAEVTSVLGADGDRGFTTIYPEPMARAALVLTVAADARLPASVLDAVRSAAKAGGWGEPNQGAGMPSPGAQEALRGVWAELAR